MMIQRMFLGIVISRAGGVTVGTSEALRHGIQCSLVAFTCMKLRQVCRPPLPPRRFWNVSAQHGESCEEQGARAALEPLGAREPYALRGAAPTTSTEAGGKLHVRHSSAQAVACSL